MRESGRQGWIHFQEFHICHFLPRLLLSSDERLSFTELDALYADKVSPRHFLTEIRKRRADGTIHHGAIQEKVISEFAHDERV